MTAPNPGPSTFNFILDRATVAKPFTPIVSSKLCLSTKHSKHHCFPKIQKSKTSFMIAPDFTFVIRKPVHNPTRSLVSFGNTCCFDPGPRSKPNFPVGPTLSLGRVDRCCYSYPRLKVEAENGGEDFFNAAARAKSVPRHLVIMVNGITGRYRFNCILGFVLF